MKQANADCTIMGQYGPIPRMMADPRLVALSDACDDAKRQAQNRLDQIKTDADRQARQQAEAARIQAQNVAELSPNNHCRDTDVAASIIDEINSMEEKRFPVRKVVDIEHLVTTSWTDDRSSMSCHGVFVFDNGLRIPASYKERPNVAGRTISTFMPD